MLFLMINSNIWGRGVLNIQTSLEIQLLVHLPFGLSLATGHIGQHGNNFLIFLNLTLFDA